MAQGDRAEEPASEAIVPVLRSLGPRYEEHLHGRHAAVLLQVLDDQSLTAARNIALAGHYGSGKSSVILGVQAGLNQRQTSWVNLSLSSLGIDDPKRARLQKDGTLAPLTNLIQKEIVKQLLYRKAPADMPGSRYFRIESFRTGPAALWSAAVAVGFFVVAVLLGLVGRVRSKGPQGLVAHHGWVSWVIVAGFSLFVGGVWLLGLRALQSRLRVDSVSAGGAAVSLSAKENSYFDEYLDEIVYFFQKTKTQVAIFEDLDRFKDPHIFETLRELNTVLNNAEQIGSRPIRFVYAVRDSIFEQLVSVGSSEVSDLATARASVLESAPSANRTKFFDLVVPMVPFITHRSARDLLAAEFAESEQQPSNALVNLVGAHLTDMRLIRNIRNEFEIYRASVLGEKGLKGLTADRLFAMMVYKNLHLDDFEAIRLGTSKIDDAHRAFRAMVDYQTRRQARISKTALDRAGSASVWDKHAKAAGERLQETLPIVQRAARRNGEPVVQLGSQTYDLSSLTAGAFWRALYESRDDLSLRAPAGVPATVLSFDDVIALVGSRAKALDDAVAADIAALQRDARVAQEIKDFVAKATMAEVMARADLLMPTGEGEQNLDAIVAELVSPLARDLLAKGYIDENYTLYCSDYHAIAISVSAMNFILHCVQADRADFRFRFDEPASIEAVEKEVGLRFLDGESVFNLEVFDHYFAARPDKLNRALTKLVVRAGEDSSFLDEYLVDGSSADSLVRWLALEWPGVFVHLVERAPIDADALANLVDAALQGAVGTISYESSGPVAEYIADSYATMQAFVGEREGLASAEFASLLRQLNVEVGDLSVLGEAQRRAVVGAGLYPITRANLLVALGDGAGLSLDEVKGTSEAVYGRVLDSVDDYIGVLRNDEATVKDSSKFLDVLNDVASAAEATIARLAKRASDECEIARLEDLDSRAWVAVVDAGRFARTARNVQEFVNNFGVSDELVHGLAGVDLSAIDGVDEEERFDLAYALIHANRLKTDEKIRLVTQLGLPGRLDPERLTESGIELIPMLLAARLVPDAAETYARVSDRDYAFRESYFAASETLDTYVCELPLSSEDVQLFMRSTAVGARAKRAIADDLDFIQARLSRQGAIAICDWGIKGNTISVELLAALSDAKAPAEQILLLLEPVLPDLSLAEIDRILVALGDEYEPLTKSGHHRPRLKDRDGTESLLDELKRHGRVSSFSRAMLGGFKVNMRH
jgi:hypothetical protein